MPRWSTSTSTSSWSSSWSCESTSCSSSTCSYSHQHHMISCNTTLQGPSSGGQCTTGLKLQQNACLPNNAACYLCPVLLMHLALCLLQYLALYIATCKLERKLHESLTWEMGQELVSRYKQQNLISPHKMGLATSMILLVHLPFVYYYMKTWDQKVTCNSFTWGMGEKLGYSLYIPSVLVSQDTTEWSMSPQLQLPPGSFDAPGLIYIAPS